MKRHTSSPWLVAVAALALVGSLTACDGLTSSASSEADDTALAAEAPELAAMAGVLTQELALTGAQQADVEKVLYRHRARRHDPSFLWTLAAELQSTLTADQKEALFARAAEAEARGGFFGPGLGVGFGPGGMGPGPFAGDPFADGGFGPGMHGPGGGMHGPGGGMHGPGGGMHGPGWGDGAWGPMDGAGSLLEQVLTEAQRDALTEIRETFRTQLDALVQDQRSGALTPEAFREAWIALREAMQAAIQEQIALTPEQEAALEQLRETRRAEHQEEMAAHLAEGRAAMQEALGLTDDQLAQIEALFEQLHTDVEALIAAGDVDVEALAALQDQFRTDVAALLDATQRETFDIYHALRLLRPVEAGWGFARGNGPGNGQGSGPGHGNGGGMGPGRGR